MTPPGRFSKSLLDHPGSPEGVMYASSLMAGAPISASAEQGGQGKGTSDQGRVGRDGAGYTHIALLK